MEGVVDTVGGPVTGRAQGAVTAFLGVPYAAPPVGPRRFRRPEPAEPWSHVRDATTFGPSPVQSATNPFAGGIPGNSVGDTSEDCLTLCVWAPAGAADRPVMVWICGGAYLTGGTDVGTYDGTALAAATGAVIVSVNYRLGALGFLHLDDGDTNCGLRDQLAALEWVRANIAAFGGNPANVTVFGESAGAGSILHLLAVMDKRRLARRAILQSPGVEHTQQPEHSARVREAVMEAAGVKEQAEMWAMPAGAVLAAQEQALPSLMAAVGSMPFHPVVDGDVVPSPPGAGPVGRGLDLLVSWTAEEGRLYPNPRATDHDFVVAAVRRLLRRRAGTDPGAAAAAGLVDLYRHAGGPADVWAAVQTDCLLRLPARRVALAHAGAAAGGVGTFAAQFDWGATGGTWRKGAFHAIDLPFTFATLECCGWLDFLGASGDDRGARELAGRHVAAWGAFAGSGSPGWAPFPDRVLRFDSEDREAGDFLAGAATAWDEVWPASGQAI